MKTKLIVLVALFCATLFFAHTLTNVGSAASLKIAASSISQTKSVACTTTTVNIKLSLSGSLTLSNIPTSCQNKPIKVHTVSSLLGLSQELTGTATSGTLVLQMTGLTGLLTSLTSIVSTRVLVSGWQVPSSFTGV